MLRLSSTKPASADFPTRETQRRGAIARATLTGLAVVALFGAPGVARAQDDEGPRPVLDARLEGLINRNGEIVDVTTKASGGYTLTWFLFAVLAGIGAGALFKDAKRSHLD